MRYVTNLMDKLYSESSPKELKDKVAQKIDEAQSKGESHLSHDGVNLKLTSLGDSILIHDKDSGEKTLATPSDNEIKLSGIPKPENQFEPSVQVNKTPAVEESHTTPLSDVNSTFSDAELNEIYQQSMIESSLCFSEDEVDSAVESAKELEAKVNKLKKTDDPDLAEEVKTDAAQLKSYSILAETYGWDTEELKSFSEYAESVADESLMNCMAETPVTQLFSDSTSEEINSLGEVESTVMYSILNSEDDSITYSDYLDIVNDTYSELELLQPVVSMFSECNEAEINSILGSMNDLEYRVFSEVIETEPTATYSDINEYFDILDTPVDQIFSDLTETEYSTFSSTFGEELTDVLYSLTEDGVDITLGDAISLYSELDSTKDTPSGEEVGKSLEVLNEATKELQKDPSNKELAAGVKDLADKTSDDIDKIAGDQVGTPDHLELKNTVHSYSDFAESLLNDEATLYSDNSISNDYELGTCLFSRIN